MTLSLSRFDPLAAGYPVKLATVTGINMAATGTTTLYTVPAGKELHLVDVRLRCTAAAGVGTPAVAGVGVAAGEDDVYAPEPLTGFTSTTAPNNAWGFLRGGRLRMVPAAGVVKLGVDTAIGAGTQTAAADVIGYLI